MLRTRGVNCPLRPATAASLTSKDAPLTTSVIFVPAEHYATYADVCLNYCSRMGYKVVGLVTTNMDDARRDARHLGAGVIVVARQDDMIEHDDLRIEVVAEQATPTQVANERRNTSRLRRPHRL